MYPYVYFIFTGRIDYVIPSVPDISTLGGEISRVLRFPEPGINWSTFNPSICRGGDGSIGMTIRSSNYVLNPANGRLSVSTGKHVVSRLFFCYVDEKTLELGELVELDIESPVELKRGVEDARLFWRDGGWQVTAVILEKHTPYARLWRFSLDLENRVARFIEAMEGPEPKRVEKNWIAVADGTSEHFDYIYSSTAIYKDGEVVGIPDAPYGHSLRGGSSLILDEDGKSYISVVHRTYGHKIYGYNPATFSMGFDYLRYYTHQFARWDLTGKLIGLTDEFVFKENGIEYAAGLVRIGDDYVISFGRWDVSTWLAKLPVSSVVFNEV